MNTNSRGGRHFLSIKEIHEEGLKLLLCFDSFCRDNGLRYSLQAGTLLGAVRHKGFIPWDDDIDVSMPRPDFEKLLKLANELPIGLRLTGPENSNIAYPFPKISTNSVRAQEPAYDGVLEEYLWMDIFVMDGVPDNARAVNLMQRRINNAMRRNVWASVNHSNEKIFKRIIKMTVGSVLRLSDQKAHMIAVMKQLSENPGYDNADRVSSLLGGAKHGWSLSKAAYEDMVEFEFEGHMFPAMGCWDEYLTIAYGDYMKLPPEEERATHHLKAWRVEEHEEDHEDA